jgi:hypothetical protein
MRVYKAGPTLGVVTDDGRSGLLGKPHVFHGDYDLHEGYWHAKTGHLFLKWDKLGWYYYRDVTQELWHLLRTSPEPKKDFRRLRLHEKPYQRIG